MLMFSLLYYIDEVKDFDLTKHASLMRKPVILDGSNSYDLVSAKNAKMWFEGFFGFQKYQMVVMKFIRLIWPEVFGRDIIESCFTVRRIRQTPLAFIK